MSSNSGCIGGSGAGRGRGDAQIGTANASTLFGATAQGAPVKAIAAQNSPSYAMVVPASVTSPEGLDGLKIGIHAQVSATSLYTNLLLKDDPTVKPDLVVLPGSENASGADRG